MVRRIQIRWEDFGYLDDCINLFYDIRKTTFVQLELAGATSSRGFYLASSTLIRLTVPQVGMETLQSNAEASLNQASYHSHDAHLGHLGLAEVEGFEKSNTTYRPRKVRFSSEKKNLGVALRYIRFCTPHLRFI